MCMFQGRSRSIWTETESHVASSSADDKAEAATERSNTIQTGNMHTHSFVLGPKAGIQYTYTCVIKSEHHRSDIDTHTSSLSQKSILQHI